MSATLKLAQWNLGIFLIYRMILLFKIGEHPLTIFGNIILVLLIIGLLLMFIATIKDIMNEDKEENKFLQQMIKILKDEK